MRNFACKAYNSNQHCDNALSLQSIEHRTRSLTQHTHAMRQLYAADREINDFTQHTQKTHIVCRTHTWYDDMARCKKGIPGAQQHVHWLVLWAARCRNALLCTPAQPFGASSKLRELISFSRLDPNAKVLMENVATRNRATNTNSKCSTNFFVYVIKRR